MDDHKVLQVGPIEFSCSLYTRQSLEVENAIKFCRVEISLKYFNETVRENFINYTI